MGWLSDAVTSLAARAGLVPASQVSALADRVAVAESTAELADTKARMMRSRLNELASGVPMSWGGYQYEHNRQLQGQVGWATRDRMEDDPAVKEALQTRTVPLITARWDIVPASEDPRDVDIADFCRAVILRKSSAKYGRSFWCQNGWESETLPNVLRALPDGFSILAKSTREVDGRIVYDRLQWIEPASVDDHGWILDRSDNLVEIRRTYRNAVDESSFLEPLNIGAIALFPWDLRGARFMGRPMTRAMYTAWYQKDILQKLALIWAQKVGSPVPIGSYPFGWDPATVAKFESFVQQCRGQSPTDAFFSGPIGGNGEKAEVIYAGSNVGDINRMGDLIDGRNAEIARGVSKSGQLGETYSGSRALSEPMGRRELMMTQATAVWACQILNHGIGNVAGLLEWLVDANFQVESYPAFTCTKIDKNEGLDNLDKLVTATDKNLLPKCREVAKAVASYFDINLPDERFDQLEESWQAAEDAKQSAVDSLRKGAADPNAADPNAADQTDAQDSADAADAPDANLSGGPSMTTAEVTARIQPLMREAYAEKPPGKRRGPNVFEDRYMNLAAMQASMDGAEKRVADILRRMRAAMTAEIVKRIESGAIATRNLGSQMQSKSRVAVQYERELRVALTAVADDGGTHVRGEIAKQKATGAKVAA